MTASSSLDGVLAPVLTPFGPDLSVDEARFIRLARTLMDQGLGLAPFGTTSEGNSLSVDEKIGLMDALAAAGLDMARMMPGTGCCALSDSVRLSAHAVTLGCGGVLMLPPFYYKNPSEDGLFAAFAETIERVGDARLRVFLYHFPQQSQVPITLSLIERLLKAYPGIVAGAKDSSGDFANMEAMCTHFPGFKVFAGTERLILSVMRAGGAGCISANANIHGAAMLDLVRRWQEPDAAKHQTALEGFRSVMEGLPLIAALKAVTARRTGEPEWRRVRPPLVQFPVEREEELMERLKGIGVLG
ncbi:dihydrodipicolinate synthase family protein [Paramagnetospirillum kuznetsovii]|uniref:Dihydrodipicolinate synthase family protein n=1 Tax=Paramagnetospirillum kuznetsovii TaxID=2053833 RepID=A0A364NW25_9PROT|nr:dihydrodipicolinate synthase family protein [Paramagnetospirillum kuznetsovii]RAU21105.1 dihydrodipicolinate synthase family protein [Paramagnetospirillum kuznetsovii]